MAVFMTGATVPNKVNYVNYLQSSGMQYIDTGVVAANGFRAKIGLTLTASSFSALCGIIGSHNSSSPYGRNFFATTGSVFQIGIGDGFYNGPSPISGTYYDFDLSNAYNDFYLSIDGNNQSLSVAATASNNYSTNTLYLLDVSGYSGFESTAAKLYYCKIYVDGILVRDFYPCFDKNGVPCLYDKVDEKYYYNAGTGAFTAG